MSLSAARKAASASACPAHAASERTAAFRTSRCSSRNAAIKAGCAVALLVPPNPSATPRRTRERLHGDPQFRLAFRRRDVVVDKPAQLVFHLRLRWPVGMAQRPVDQLASFVDLIARQGSRPRIVRGPTAGVRMDWRVSRIEVVSSILPVWSETGAERFNRCLKTVRLPRSPQPRAIMSCDRDAEARPQSNLEACTLLSDEKARALRKSDRLAAKNPPAGMSASARMMTKVLLLQANGVRN